MQAMDTRTAAAASARTPRGLNAPPLAGVLRALGATLVACSVQVGGALAQSAAPAPGGTASAPATAGGAPAPAPDLRAPLAASAPTKAAQDAAAPRPWGSGYESRGLAVADSASGAARGNAEEPGAARPSRSIWSHRPTPIGRGAGGGRGRR